MKTVTYRSHRRNTANPLPYVLSPVIALLLACLLVANVQIEHFEDGSGIVKLGAAQITYCVPAELCND